MKFTIEVETKVWYKVEWEEEVDNYDQREGSYKSWIDRSEIFLKNDEAQDLITRLLEHKTGIRKILFSEIEQIKE